MLWFHEGFDADHRLERVLPDGSMEIIINLRDEKAAYIRSNQLSVARKPIAGAGSPGRTPSSSSSTTAPNASMIGVHLRPGGGSAFFDLPLCELRNSVVELDTIWNCDAQNLRDQLLEAARSKPPNSAFSRMHCLPAGRGLAPRHRAVRHAPRIFQVRAGKYHGRQSDWRGRSQPATAHRSLHRADRNDAEEIFAACFDF